MAVTYRHIRAARKPAIWLAGAVCLSLMAAGALHGAPPLFWTFCGCFGLAVLFALKDSAAGLELDSTALTAFAQGKAWHFELDRIQHVELRRSSTGPGDVVLALQNGRRVRLPILSTPEPGRFACALARYGLRLETA
ncbi:MAG: PH domain-containing protein [Dinoroseobacter sp.]|nr:PH domain-containing protein [Dinoroseobacter sp.]